MKIKDKDATLLDENKSQLSHQLYQETVKRVYRPTVLEFFERFKEDGLLSDEVDILLALSNDSQTALLEMLTVHVHKEKPVIMKMIGDSLDLDSDQVSAVAVSVDLLWAISLMYDDMFDEDMVRCGVQTTWVRYGKQRTVEICQEIFAAVLKNLEMKVGKEVAQLAQQYVQKGLDSLEEHKLIGLGADKEQLYDNYNSRNDFNGTFGVRALFLLAGKSQSADEELGILFIRNLNLASQLLNDLKDIDDFYNRGYSDIRNGAVTVPLNDLYQALSADEREKFNEIFGSKRELEAHEIEFILDILTRHDVLLSTVRQIYDYYLAAEEIAVEIFSEENFKQVQKWITYKKEPVLRYV